MVSKYIRGHWIDLAALVIAIISLLFSIFPQSNPLNDNLIEKANAGDIDSQMLLANMYYEIGNVGESVQWYSIASAHSGEHQAKSINNLAVIYLTDNRFDLTRQENEYDAMKMFMAATKLGEIDSAKNLYLLLISYPDDLFNDEYPEAMEFARTQLLENGITLDTLDKYQTQWELVDTVTGEYVPPNDGVYRQKLIKSELVIQNEYPVWVDTYEIYRKKDGVDDPEYIYIKVE